MRLVDGRLLSPAFDFNATVLRLLFSVVQCCTVVVLLLPPPPHGYRFIFLLSTTFGSVRSRWVWFG